MSSKFFILLPMRNEKFDKSFLCATLKPPCLPFNPARNRGNRGTFVQSVLDIRNIFARGVSGKGASLLLTCSAAPSPAFEDGGKETLLQHLC